MPGDSYTVSGDHEFVAQWEKTVVKSNKDTDGKKLAKTGDGGFALIALTIALAAGAALAGTALHRRRTDRD